MAKSNRFNFQKFFPDLPLGWGAYSDRDIEEKVFFGNFVEASSYFQKKHESGDEKAIFTFVRNCPECFREIWPSPDGTFFHCYSNNILKRKGARSWVIEQIEKWKNEDTPAATRKLKRLLKAYIDGRGHEKKSPEEDWKIFIRIKRFVMTSKYTITEAIQEVAYEDIVNLLGPKLVRLLEKHSVILKKDDSQISKIAQSTKIPQRIIRNYYNTRKIRFNTYREIYYKLSKLEKKYKEDAAITEKNLRFEYFLPHKGKTTIPKKYKDKFDKELSLFCDVEWLRQGFISFPRYRSGLSIYSGVRPFEGKRLSLKKALEKVSKEKNVPLEELKEIYTDLLEFHAMDAGPEVLEVLKAL